MKLADMLAEVVARGASDLHLTPQSPPMLRIAGDLTPLDAPAPGPEGVAPLFAPFLPGVDWDGVRVGKDVNTSLEREGNRFRCCLFRDRAGLCAAVRLVPSRVPTLTELFGEDAEVFRSLARNTRRGLILLVGEVGSGKATTVAAMLNEINTERSERIITIEDPVDYVHTSRKSLFSQREVGKDVESLEQGALSALRADLDVALISELRTPEAVRIALTLADTGHLVFSTLLASSVSEAIRRLTEAFPEAGEALRGMLARTVVAVIAQRLLPHSVASGPGRMAVHEILIATTRVRDMIAAGEADLTLTIEAGRNEGMQTMDDAVLKAYRAGKIGYDIAWRTIRERGVLGPMPTSTP